MSNFIIINKFIIVICVILNSGQLLNAADAEPRIVGGQFARSGQFPYQVSLQTIAHYCGGSLVDLRHVVTAAHCAEDMKPEDIVVWAGGTSLYIGGEKQHVKSIIIHKGWTQDNYDSDIAILKLKKPFKESFYIKPISLVNSITAEGVACNVSGWGSTYSGGIGVKQLKFTEVKVANHSQCKKNYKESSDNPYHLNLVNDNMICAASLWKDACQGDSGGPLVVNNKLIGVVSFGFGCADPRYPGVYTSVYKFRKWILKNSLASCNSVQHIQIIAMVLATTIYTLFFK